MVRRLLVVWLLLMLAAVAANAADAPAGITGLFFTTRYPALTVRAGETTTIDLSVRNFKLPPQLLTLSVPQVTINAGLLRPACRLGILSPPCLA